MISRGDICKIISNFSNWLKFALSTPHSIFQDLSRAKAISIGTRPRFLRFFKGEVVFPLSPILAFSMPIISLCSCGLRKAGGADPNPRIDPGLLRKLVQSFKVSSSTTLRAFHIIRTQKTEVIISVQFSKSRINIFAPTSLFLKRSYCFEFITGFVAARSAASTSL